MAMAPALILLMVLLIWNRWPGRAAYAENIDGAVWIALGVVLAWPILSALWSITPSTSALTGARVAATMVMGVVALALCRQVVFPKAAVTGLAVTMGICILALISELIPGGGVIRWCHAAMSMDYARFIDKNINRGLCALVILSWPISTALFLRGHRRLAVALPLVLALPVFGFDSVSAQVACIVGLLMFGLTWLWPRAWPKALTVLIPLGVLAWPLVFPILDQAILSKPAIYAALPDTAQHRVEIWRFVLDRVAERPWLGWGMDTARAMPGADIAYDGPRKYLPLHPHNSALQILLEIGVIGFSLAVAALWWSLRQWVRLDCPSVFATAAAAALIGAYISIGFTAFGVWQYWWIGLGWIAAVLWRMAVRVNA
jgi:exopolysaccharide production protein ExoQ